MRYNSLRKVDVLGFEGVGLLLHRVLVDVTKERHTVHVCNSVSLAVCAHLGCRDRSHSNGRTHHLQVSCLCLHFFAFEMRTLTTTSTL